MYLHTKSTIKKKSNRLDLLFEKQCKKNENKAAVIIAGGKTYTYRELNEKANQLARFLIKKGIHSGSKVGILLDKSIYTYITLLAILKANAAYVPLDITFPTDRIKYIANDANLSFIVSHSDFSFIFDENKVNHIFLDEHYDEIEQENIENIKPEEKGTITDNLCYIIYTSGTTGNPKGVAIEHESICNFVQEASGVYGIKETDRVYQGMIIAFDFSIEEIWVPLISGAAIVPAKSAKCMLGGELNDFLIDNQVTVMCCVPTLLATLEKDIPSLRLLLVGGEACPHDLVVKWHNKNRQILNTYGPTETTVTATWTELTPEKPVTIGKPLPSYTVVILDEENKLLPRGSIGEICIAGIGLARGYVNRDDLTKEVFIPDFLDLPENPSKRIYKTGDLGRINDNNEIEYLGRIDTQVKIRGYRIELTEIESVFLHLKGVAQVAVNPYTFDNGTTELVAYCVLEKDVEKLPTNINAIIGKKLPGYMIPAYIEIVDSLPMSASSKVDRKKLPKPTSSRIITRTKEVIEPQSETEVIVAEVLCKALNLEHISINDNIFDDLGGHSLSIAFAVSDLRKRGYTVGLTDFYTYPTVQTIASHLEKVQKDGVASKEKEEHYKVTDKRYWFMGFMQVFFLFLYTVIATLPSVIILQNIILNWSEYTTKDIASLSLLLFVVMFCVSLILPIITKWLLLGKVKEGKYKLWSGYMVRFWLVNKTLSAAPYGFFRGTVVMNLFYRLLGIKIGKDVMLNTPFLYGFDMVEIGDHTTIGIASNIYGYEIRNGYIHFSKVSIGSNCFIGANSIVMPNSIMEDGSYLGDQSLLQDATIPKDERWIGSPARKEKERNTLLEEINELSQKETDSIKVTPNFWTTVGILLLKPSIFLIIVAFSLALFSILFYGIKSLNIELLSNLSIYTLITNDINFVNILSYSTVATLGFLIIFPLAIIIAHKIFMPRIKEGIYPVNSFMYIRKLISDSLIASTLTLMNSMYATLYLPSFLRKLGAKIGKHSEISTVANITPSLLEVNDESFLADIATVGPYYIHKGYFGVKRVKIGKRSFIGNAAYVPAGSNIANEALIGVLSMPCSKNIKEGTTCLGSPAFELPRREESKYFDESLTFKPSKELYIKRWIYEFFRIAIPPFIFLLFGIINFLIFYKITFAYSALETAIIFPLVLLLSGFIMHMIVVLFKKVFIGTYKPKVKPLWDIFVRRSELVTALYENITVPAFLSALSGTPLMAPILRMYGIKVGKRCYIETTYMTEFDLVEIGNDCSVGAMTSLQTHLFEDRVMKMSYVRIGDGCSIGVRSVILYDSYLEKDVVLDSLSLVMKGETLLKGYRYRGIPVAKVV